MFITAKVNVRNIRPITKYSYFNYKENDDVEFKFDFAAQTAFLPDVTYFLLDDPNTKNVPGVVVECSPPLKTY